MKAGLRLGMGLWVAALALAPVAAPAQEANQPAATAPSPSDTVGPRDLQNFDLQGNVTRPDNRAPAPLTSAPRPSAQAPTTQNVVQSVAGSPAAERTSPAPARNGNAAPDSAPAEPAESRPTRSAHAPAAEPLRQTRPASSVTVALPRLDNGAVRSTANAPVPVATAGLDSPATVPAENKLAILPWLLAAFALGAGAAFLLLRSRAREALAGGPALDAFAAPQPEPAPAPAPAPAPRAPRRTEPSIPGIVSTRLRPWLDILFMPTSCLVEDHQVTFEFEVELLNSGNAPARGVLVEATLFNASNNQDRELEAFFANPLAQGSRIPVIQPLKRVRIKSKVVAERKNVQVYDIRGRKVFVPIVAFNALYRWNSGEGQTSASYVLGIDTRGEKMAPFRVDLGSRLFSAVTARELPTALRR
jgi:hypothetical protein